MKETSYIRLKMLRCSRQKTLSYFCISLLFNNIILRVFFSPARSFGRCWLVRNTVITHIVIIRINGCKLRATTRATQSKNSNRKNHISRLFFLIDNVKTFCRRYHLFVISLLIDDLFTVWNWSLVGEISDTSQQNCFRFVYTHSAS